MPALAVLLLPSTGWWSEFVRSPGFGGVAAVLAASIAFEAGRRSVRHQREASRKQQWWDRARWALDLTLAGDEDTQEVGFGVLVALADSEYAAEHEASIIEAALHRSRMSSRPRMRCSGDPGQADEDPAHWSRNEGDRHDG